MKATLAFNGLSNIKPIFQSFRYQSFDLDYMSTDRLLYNKNIVVNDLILRYQPDQQQNFNLLCNYSERGGIYSSDILWLNLDSCCTCLITLQQIYTCLIINRGVKRFRLTGSQPAIACSNLTIATLCEICPKLTIKTPYCYTLYCYL